MIAKTFMTSLLLFIIGYVSYGQKTEISFNAYTAFFGFHGNGTTSTSYITADQAAPEPNSFTSNVYGKDGSFSYSLELQAQRITKRKMIYGVGVAFEQLNSKVNIDSVRLIVYGSQYPLTGNTFLKNSFITLNPYIGRRFIVNKISLDFLLGTDIAFCQKSQEDSKTKLYNDPNHFTNPKDKPSVDFRPRVQVKAEYKNFGLLLGYSLGLTDYKKESETEAYSNLVRLGISYRLK
jgi:hypothetical protein